MKKDPMSNKPANVPDNNVDKCVDVLLSNLNCYYEGKDHIYSETEKNLSKDEVSYIVKEGWARSKFKKMVSIQPMQGPVGLVYHMDNSFAINSEAIASKVRKMNFSIFKDASFENVKDVYAEALAKEIDFEIFKKLPNLVFENLMDRFLLDKTSLIEELKEYDYLIGPKALIDKLKEEHLGLDLFEHFPIINEELKTTVAAGKYPEHLFQKPIFAPYILLISGPTVVPGITSTAMMRVSWFEDAK
jgi:hypothetical protein